MKRVRSYDPLGRRLEYRVAPPSNYFPRRKSFVFRAGPRRSLLVLNPQAPPRARADVVDSVEAEPSDASESPDADGSSGGEPDTRPQSESADSEHEDRPNGNGDASKPDSPVETRPPATTGTANRRSVGNRLDVRSQRRAQDNLLFASIRRAAPEPLVGWRLLDEGRYLEARRAFVAEQRQYPKWGLPQAGEALALAALTDGKEGVARLRRAFAEDAEALKTLPGATEKRKLMEYLRGRSLSRSRDTQSHPDAPFMAAALSYFLRDKTAAESAIQHDAEVVGSTTSSTRLKQLIDSLPDRR